MGKKAAPKAPEPVPKTTMELIEDAAANPNLTPREMVMNLGRLALHLGTTDGAKLKIIGPALGNMALALSKVAAAEVGPEGGASDDDALLQAFVRAQRK